MERYVTDTQTVGKGKKRVYINDEPAYLLYDSELRELGLKQGCEMTPQREIEVKIRLVKRARLRCMNILTKSDKTTWQLRKKLMDGEYPEDVIEDAIGYVASFHYIDDLRYAKNYIADRSESRSRKQIETDLTTRGVSRDLIDQAFEESEPVDVQAQIFRWMEKKRLNLEQADRKEIDKFVRFLQYKGYSWNEIRCAISRTLD